MVPLRIANTSLPAYFIPVAVTSDWVIPLNAGIDVHAATGFPIVGEPLDIIYDLYFEFWNGLDDDDDYACLQFDAGAETFAYKDIVGSATPWATPPTNGAIVYLVMTRVKK